MIKCPDIALREIFHFFFLEQLLRISDPRLYVLKGGVNLRFFFNSPRYSEDMDLDVVSGNADTLKKNCYKILKNAALLRSLNTYGITSIMVNDPLKAKQTQTTQRFKLRLVTKQGLELPTKIECSRRGINEEYVEENINPEVSRNYNRLTYKCQHYTGEAAVEHKIKALAGRTETQARDVFDLFILSTGGFWRPETKNIPSDIFNKARANLLTISHQQYQDQVVEFLADEEKGRYSGRETWSEIKNLILDKLS